MIDSLTNGTTGVEDLKKQDDGKLIDHIFRHTSLVRGKSVMMIPDDQKEDLRAAMTSIISAVKASGYAKWPVVVGTSPQ